MLVTIGDLEVIKFWVNPDYKVGQLALTKHEVIPTSVIEYLDHINRKLTLSIDTTFDDKSTGVNICSAKFSQTFDVQITGEPNNDLERDVFHNDIIKLFEDLRKYLSANIPKEIIQLATFLIPSFEVRELAFSIYEELKKR